MSLTNARTSASASASAPTPAPTPAPEPEPAPEPATATAPVSRARRRRQASVTSFFSSRAPCAAPPQAHNHPPLQQAPTHALANAPLQLAAARSVVHLPALDMAPEMAAPPAPLATYSIVAPFAPLMLPCASASALELASLGSPPSSDTLSETPRIHHLPVSPDGAAAPSRKRLRRTPPSPSPSPSPSPFPPRSRPRTRATLRANQEQPSGVGGAHSATASTQQHMTDVDDNAGDEPSFTHVRSPFISRLNKARNKARRAKRSKWRFISPQCAPPAPIASLASLAPPALAALADAHDTASSEEPPVMHVVDDDDQLHMRDVVDVDVSPPVQQRTPFPTASAKKKSLHPFFATTAAAVHVARDKPKILRLERPVCDAWFCPSATIHVNAEAPLAGYPRTTEGSSLSHHKNAKPAHETSASKFLYHSHTTGNETMRQDASADKYRAVIAKPVESAYIWAEHYKNDARLDVINAMETKELEDWLRTWYEKRQAGNDESSSEMSMMSEYGEEEVDERERMALITGPVGCGKSTVVMTAARQLGLSVLEINSSVCRSGRRVRDIIGEALRTHRVSHSSINGMTNGGKLSSSTDARSTSAKTLIVFEEVDELQADEKGFWASLQELAQSQDCKRPIVCTANTVTWYMRQMFAEQKEGARQDLDRLLLNTKEEILKNGMEFKHISFGACRSERQRASVLQRIIHSERVATKIHLSDSLSVLHRYDTRRAINELQLWGCLGLMEDEVNCLEVSGKKKKGRKNTQAVLTDRQFNTALGVIQNNWSGTIAPSLFSIGCENYVNRPNDESTESDTTTLDRWAASLDAMSTGDAMLGRGEIETRSRTVESRLPNDAINLDHDLQTSTHMVDDILQEAYHHSKDVLSLPSDATHLRNISHDSRIRDGNVAPIQTLLPHVMPKARRPLVIDYVPTLISMVRSEPSGNKDNNSDMNRSIRRTRSRTRKCGLSALDLDGATLSALKKASIAPE